MIDTIEQQIIRVANSADADAILAFDLIAQGDETRQTFIREAIERGCCTIVEVEGQAAAYIIVER